MQLLRANSIKKKMTMVSMLICTISLLMVCFGFILYDFFTFKSEMARELNTLAEIIGTNCFAALVFDNPNDANNTLLALKAKQNIRRAIIYTQDGQPFSNYSRRDIVEEMPIPMPEGYGHKFVKGHLNVFRSIILDGEKIGTVFIQSDLEKLYSRLQRYVEILLVVLSISLLAAFLMTRKLQQIISQPILNLARMAKVVSDKQDLSVRAVKQSDDEIGFLAQRFNEMLTLMQVRDDELNQANEGLESHAKKLKRQLKVRKLAEKALQKSEQRFRDLFDNAPDMYMVLDSESSIIDHNKSVLDRLGYNASQITGKRVLSLFHPDDARNAERFFERIKQTGRPPAQIEARLVTKNEQICWVSIQATLVKSELNKIQSIRVVCRDITEQKRLQTELARAQRLEAAGRIAGQIAHDFNNLLGPLAGYPGLIRLEMPAEHPALQWINEMEDAAKKIAEINQQLLALGRRGHYTMESVDLNSLLEGMLTAQHLSDEVEVRKHFAPNLLPVKVGAAQLTRAISNLINNGIESMSGKGVLTISTENVYLDEPLRRYKTINRGEYVRLNISDTGTGIESAVIDKIFDPFFTTKMMDRIRGSGLGLSVVHGIIEDHNGYVTVEDTSDKGTTFSVYFPVSREAPGVITPETIKIAGGNESILIVDDDPVQRRVTSQILKGLGYVVHTAASGEQAIQAAKKESYDLLILDMVMDGIDGAEAYARILEFQPFQKAIILSGYAMSQQVKQAIALGAGEFVPKPVSHEVLASAVRRQLDAKMKESKKRNIKKKQAV